VISTNLQNFGSFTTLGSFSMLLPFLPLFVQQLGIASTSAIVQWSGVAFGWQRKIHRENPLRSASSLKSPSSKAIFDRESTDTNFS
jgi:hypothetical protein